MGGLDLASLKLSHDAGLLWVKFYDEVELAQGKNGQYADIKGFASKAAEHAARLAGVLTIVDNIQAPDIPATHMSAAIELMHYYLAEHVRLTNVWGVDPDIILAERVLEHLKTCHDNGLFCLIDIYQQLDCVRTKDCASRIVRILEHHHCVFKYPVAIKVLGKQRREVWQVHPQLLDDNLCDTSDN